MSTEERTEEEGIEQRTDGGLGFATGGVIRSSCPLGGDSGCYWPKPNGALALGPDDKLVISISSATATQVQEMVRTSRAVLGDRVVVVVGVEIAAVRSVSGDGGSL